MKNKDSDEFVSEIKNALGDDFVTYAECLRDLIRTRIVNRGDIKDVLMFDLATAAGLKEELDKLLSKFFTPEELREMFTQGISSFAKRNN